MMHTNTRAFPSLLDNGPLPTLPPAPALSFRRLCWQHRSLTLPQPPSPRPKAYRSLHSLLLHDDAGHLSACGIRVQYPRFAGKPRTWSPPSATAAGPWRRRVRVCRGGAEETRRHDHVWTSSRPIAQVSWRHPPTAFPTSLRRVDAERDPGPSLLCFRWPERRQTVLLAPAPPHSSRATEQGVG